MQASFEKTNRRVCSRQIQVCVVLKTKLKEILQCGVGCRQHTGADLHPIVTEEKLLGDIDGEEQRP